MKHCYLLIPRAWEGSWRSVVSMRKAKILCELSASSNGCDIKGCYRQSLAEIFGVLLPHNLHLSVFCFWCPKSGIENCSLEFLKIPLQITGISTTLNSSIHPPRTNEISLARTSKWVTVFSVWHGQAFTSEICWVFQVYLEYPACCSDLAGAAQQKFCISAWACLQPSAWGTLWKGWYMFELSLKKTEISSHALSGSRVKGKQQFLRRRRYCCCLALDFGCMGSWLACLGEQRCLRNLPFSAFSISYLT